MSLLLRKLCQPILDDYGLGHLHATEIDYNKTFRLTTECGKVTTTVTGIKFTKISPNMQEIKYAAELLGDYLAKNKLKVDAYLTAKATYNKLSAKNKALDLFTYTHRYGEKGTSRTIFYVADDVNINVTIKRDGSHVIELTSRESLTKSGLINYQIDKHLIKTMLINLKYDAIAADAKYKAEKAFNAFSACTI